MILSLGTIASSFNLFYIKGYFRIRVCFESHTATAPKAFSQETKACSNSSPGKLSVFSIKVNRIYSLIHFRSHVTLQVQLHVVFPERGGLHLPFELYLYDQLQNFRIPSPALLRSNQTFHWNTDWMPLLTGCKENYFYSLPFGQAKASIY